MWSGECEKSSNKFKQVLTSEPILRVPNLSKPFFVQTDASNFATSGILLQEHEGGSNQGIVFRKTHLLVRSETYTSTPFGKKIEMLRAQTSSTRYSPTWEKTSAKEMKKQVENGRRLCVGFGWATHEKQPFCYACDSLYTVRHILIECSDFQVIKRK
ncbi:retrovirus-related pol polyprotein from transposon 17.6 [Plakobranchus ocellatus]|uniref:Retrovirus-related pol polyprotein from transposon 17.6 n=1 Tax=Plakobranchus ocellatus TaxID=259542 RepID=A0AAV4B2P8_9GAST|nr:retrovirus-related pol polyprotein from transposon 17.6 [Plakobranchus ocellatus]